MGTTFFTSDLHVGHQNILAYCSRPFSSIKAHDNILIDNWNDTVTDDDIVWVLGDYSLRGGVAHGALERVKELRGRKRLVSGNHDPCWVGKRDAARFIPDYLQAGFELVTPWATAKLGPHHVLLSHFPYAGDSHDADRFDAYRLRDTGVPLLHGHTHAMTKVTRSPTRSIQLHVGVDAWEYMPVAGHVLEGMLETAQAEDEILGLTQTKDRT